MKHVLRGQTGKRKRHSGTPDIIDLGDNSEDEEEGLGKLEVESEGQHKPTNSKPLGQETNLGETGKQEAAQRPVIVTDAPMVVGGALRRSEDGTTVVPTVRKKSKVILPVSY